MICRLRILWSNFCMLIWFSGLVSVLSQCVVISSLCMLSSVCWVNSNCLGVCRKSGCSMVSLVCAPGHCFSPEESSTLSALIIRYSNEVLHNIYCNRLFVWEQVWNEDVDLVGPNWIVHITMQEQYLEEGIEWDEVEVEFNESLINCFHQVSCTYVQADLVLAIVSHFRRMGVCCKFWACQTGMQ